MTGDNRERSLEQWLQRTSGTAATAGDGCLDAETLAAWLDGGLSGAARDSAVEHAARCARCQALLATSSRIDIAPPNLAAHDDVPSWRRWLTWVAPLTAVAAAVLAIAVWLRAPAPSAPVQPQFDSASKAAPVEEPPARSEFREQGSATAAQPSRPAGSTPGAAVGTPAAEQARPTLPRSESQRLDALERADARQSPAKERGNDPPPASPAQASANAVAVPQIDSRDAAVVIASPPAPAGSSIASQPPALGGTQVRADRPQAVALAPTARARVLSDQDSWVVVSSPDQMVRWRFSGNRVQHTRDGGARWTPAVPAEAPETLTAGSAPTPTICWFVGRSGLVLLASEDSPLVRLNFPQRVDFSSIDAEDARRASATTVDGRVFTTADGGQSWRQR